MSAVAPNENAARSSDVQVNRALTITYLGEAAKWIQQAQALGELPINFAIKAEEMQQTLDRWQSILRGEEPFTKKPVDGRGRGGRTTDNGPRTTDH